ncbi:hypothetical protein J5Y03_17500 [Bacillus sp. RG28]|uniref:Uncharacterized protein n=1 Tax=Gottfriedia endophytica TaxID=2820819 RepID=A0A940NUE3_9BACI|nr:hypothetical protein [Gottfriedia endophytica]MBP0726956.1 hypothetical protein [Gottfriedia endophytica]
MHIFVYERLNNESRLTMKELITNMIFLMLGVVIFTIELVYKFNDTLGWLLATVGVLLFGIGLFYKSRKPIKFFIEFFIHFF